MTLLFVSLLVGNGLALAYLFFHIGKQRRWLEEMDGRTRCPFNESRMDALARVVAVRVAEILKEDTPS